VSRKRPRGGTAGAHPKTEICGNFGNPYGAASVRGGGSAAIAGATAVGAGAGGDRIVVAPLQIGAGLVLRSGCGVARHRGESGDVLLGDSSLESGVIDRRFRWWGGLLALASFERQFLKADVTPIRIRVGAQQLIGARDGGGILLRTGRR
jgi:hypothetical protein